MVKTATIILAAALTAGATQAQAAPTALSVHAGGRTQLSLTATEAGPATSMVLYPGRKMAPLMMTPLYAYQWPGAYFEAVFKGTDVDVQLDDAVNNLRLIVDGGEPILLQKPGHIVYPVRDLDSGEHHIRLEVLSEMVPGPARFNGFVVPDPGQVLPAPPPRSRQVEIIGDSYVAGYGTTSTKHECTPDEIHDTTDTQQAFGPLLARHYDADYQINAVSGIGMVRNYDGSAGPVIPDIYPYTFFDKTVPYAAPSWQPRIVVIALGDNDFATPVKPGEKWADLTALRADFIATYETFVKGIRAHNPNATFILMDYGEPELIPDLQTIASDLTAAGDTRILTFSPGASFEQTGCDWHLSLNDHKRIASGLEAFIDAHPAIWQ